MKEGITILWVEVYAPAYDKSYDMRVEEQTSIRQLMEEMTVLIGQKERNYMAGELEKLCLCSIERGEMLSREQCLPRLWNRKWISVRTHMKGNR